MSPKVVRVLAMAVFFAIGIPGMIVSSIDDNSGAAVTFGVIAVIAAVALLAATAVTTPRLPPHLVDPSRTTFAPGRAATGGSDGAVTESDAAADAEAEAEALEAHVRQLVASGADEDQVRDLVRRAVRMARLSSNRS